VCSSRGSSQSEGSRSSSPYIQNHRVSETKIGYVNVVFALPIFKRKAVLCRDSIFRPWNLTPLIDSLQSQQLQRPSAEAESKEKYCVWDPMPEFTKISLYVDSRVDSNTCTMLWANLCLSRLYPPVKTFGFGFWLLRHFSYIFGNFPETSISRLGLYIPLWPKPSIVDQSYVSSM
jgi:hypothetical protein